jgi:tRNA threonylcarbamoyladenosine biosynthesis protein TsaE
MKYEFMSRSEDQTVAIGQHIGAHLKGGEIILLQSDLGGGKTTITKGLAQGVGCSEPVSSPTFTITQVYSGGRMELHHYDLYRLGEMGLMNEELQEIIRLDNVVIVIEWPELAINSLPKERVLNISLLRQKSGEYDRLVIIEYEDNLSYVIEAQELEAEQC